MSRCFFFFFIRHAAPKHHQNQYIKIFSLRFNCIQLLEFFLFVVERRTKEKKLNMWRKKKNQSSTESKTEIWFVHMFVLSDFITMANTRILDYTLQSTHIRRNYKFTQTDRNQIYIRWFCVVVIVVVVFVVDTNESPYTQLIYTEIYAARRTRREKKKKKRKIKSFFFYCRYMHTQLVNKNVKQEKICPKFLRSSACCQR